MGAVLRSLARSPFVLAVARSVDLLGAFNEPMPYENADPYGSDALAMHHDWLAVGGDVAAAVRRGASRRTATR